MNSLPLASVYFGDNPLEAEEFVWLTSDMKRAELLLLPRPTPYKVDKIAYLIDKAPELNTRFNELTNGASKQVDFRRLKVYRLRSCGVASVPIVAALNVNREAQ